MESLSVCPARLVPAARKVTGVLSRPASFRSSEISSRVRALTTIFGTRAGDYKLGPATLKCNLAVKKRVRNMSALDDDFLNDKGMRDPYFEDFFTRYERYPVELKSDEASLVLLALPQEGRPEDFSGAVGDYQFIYAAGPKKVKVGDPVTLKREAKLPISTPCFEIHKAGDVAAFIDAIVAPSP